MRQKFTRVEEENIWRSWKKLSSENKIRPKEIVMSWA